MCAVSVLFKYVAGVSAATTDPDNNASLLSVHSELGKIDAKVALPVSDAQYRAISAMNGRKGLTLSMPSS
jgi:hypothetical protein